MTFSIFDAGNLVVSYDEQAEAQAALARVLDEDPESVERLLVVVYDDEGSVVGDYAPGDELRG